LADTERKSHFDYYREAKALEKSGRYEAALEAYTKAIEISRDYGHAWYCKAQLHYRLEQYRDCVECAERALALQPNWSEHITNLMKDAQSRI
jgi:tetratricopeptide (TPR) repeat protein